MEQALRITGSSLRIHKVQKAEDGIYEQGILNLLNIDNITLARFAYGTVDGMCGKAAYEYIAKSIELAMQKKVAAVATAPINKEALKAGYEADIAYNHYSASAKGYALGYLPDAPDDGFIKLVVDKKTKHLLGTHIVGHEASVLIQPFINLLNAGEAKIAVRHEEIASPTAKELRATGLSRNLLPQSVYTIGETMTPHPSLQEVTMWTRYYYEKK